MARRLWGAESPPAACPRLGRQLTLCSWTQGAQAGQILITHTVFPPWNIAPSASSASSTSPDLITGMHICYPVKGRILPPQPESVLLSPSCSCSHGPFSLGTCCVPGPGVSSEQMCLVCSWSRALSSPWSFPTLATSCSWAALLSPWKVRVFLSCSRWYSQRLEP